MQLTPTFLRHTVAAQYQALDETGRFSGYGAVFGTVDAYKERLLPGAFTQSLQAWAAKGRMPALLWQHRPDQPIGVWRVMREDDRGLYVEGQLADTTLAREAYSLLKMGAISGLSIGFNVTDESYDKAAGVRELRAVDLWETSVVTFPANTDAQVSQVKAAGTVRTVREFEHFLRDAGWSANQAKAIASRGFNAVLRDEASSKDQIDQQWLAQHIAQHWV